MISRREYGDLLIAPLTEAHWRDFERLFGPRGACAGCWCMYLRTTGKRFDANCAGGGAANREAFRAVVGSGAQPGLLAWRRGEPMGWVAVAPREDYGRVLRSPVHKPLDEAAPVYAITCFFIARGYRGQGVADALLDAAVAFARARGAAVVEAYPLDVRDERRPPADMWRGSLKQFERAGFSVAARRRPSRPIVRKMLQQGGTAGGGPSKPVRPTPR